MDQPDDTFKHPSRQAPDAGRDGPTGGAAPAPSLREKPALPSREGRPSYVAVGAPGEVESHKDDIFFAAIETTRMPMLVTDPRQPDNPVVFANRAFVAMTGYSFEEVKGRNCRFLQGPQTDPAAVAELREALRARREISLELLNYRKDGSTFWNALFISPVHNRSGELVYFFASQLDVSRRRDAEEALSQAQKMEALGQLTGGISHDFNNLLQVMSGHLDLLRLKCRANPPDVQQIERSVEGIRKAVHKASTLTQQLLAFSRKQTLRGRVVNLNKLLTGMSDLVQRTLGETIRIDYGLDPQLPNAELDTTQFELAMLNLFVNSRDAMHDGGTIRVTTKGVDVSADDGAAFGVRAGRYACVAVTDSGRGIPAELLPRVMDPFFTTKDEGQGTGLGLSMVYGFARQSGGRVSIYSEEGEGTTVRMYFPAVDAAVAGERVGGEASARGGRETVLVVDDRDEVAEIARDMLSGLGYRVQVMHGARQALDWVETAPEHARPQLLFSDVVMPGGMNGYALAREMRRLVPGLRVLLTTGFDRDFGRSEPVASSEFAVIRKPYRLNELAQRVRAVLDSPG